MKGKRTLVMGAQLLIQSKEIDKNRYKRPTKEDYNEKYFRPSKLPILNNKNLNFDFLNKLINNDPTKIVIPKSLLNSPEDTIINYFSLLREAENLKSDQNSGCGSIGMAKYPYPISYAFFIPAYQKQVGYKDYLKSFEGIAHINLIKLQSIPKDENYPNYLRYFIEIETIEGSSKELTYFAYYYGYIYIAKEGDLYKIADFKLYGEDFLCAPYHGWSHNAEASVDIKYGNWCSLVKERYPTERSCYIKNIPFKGTDGNDYMIKFFQLTNGTDIEIAQYKKDANGNWQLIHLDPNKCLEKNKQP